MSARRTARHHTPRSELWLRPDGHVSILYSAEAALTSLREVANGARRAQQPAGL